MRALLPVIAIALALLAGAGLAVWVWLPTGWRRLTLPALPLLGAMALAVSLHLTGLVVGVRTGLPVLGGVALVGLVLRSWRQPWWRDLLDRGGLLGLGAALVIGGVAFWFLLAPARPLGLDLVAPGGGSDSFAYVSPAAWLEDHPLTQVPTDQEPPVWAYTQLQLKQGFRMGEELDQAAVAVATGHDPLDTWYTVASLWVLILPGGLIAAASVIRLSRLVGAFAGVLSATSAVVLAEVIYSHSAGALGLAMAPLAVALVVRHIDDAVAQSEGRPPAWFAAGAFTALACTYTEYLPALAVAALLVILLRRRGQLGRSLRAAGVLAGLAVLMGPLAWARLGISFSHETSLASSGGQASTYLGIPLRTIAAHYVGTLGNLEPGPGSQLSYIPLLALAAGVVLAVTIGPARRFFRLVIGSIAFLILVLSTVRYFPYGQGEVVQVTFPLVMLAVAAGYAALLGRLATLRVRRWALPSAAALAAALASTFAAVNVHTVLPFLAAYPNQFPAEGIYDRQEFAAVHDWLIAKAGPSGAGAMVLDTQVWDQVWLMYTVRDMTKLNFPYVVDTYGNAEPTTRYFDGSSRRFAVVEKGLLMDVSPGVVVGGSGDFSFLDLSRGTAVVTLGAGLSFNPISVDPGIGTVQWMGNKGKLLIFHSASVTTVTLGLVAVPQLAPNTLRITASGRVLTTTTVTGQRQDVHVPLPPGNAVLLTLMGSRRAAVVPPDGRLRSVGLVGISAGG